MQRKAIRRGYHAAATPTSSPEDLLLVGALRLDVSDLLALVANLFASRGRLLGAVARVMARLAAIVALHAVDAFPRHVAVATARVARLAGTAATESTASKGRLGTVASNVSHLTALVTFGGLTTGRGASAHGAVTRDVAGLAAFVARLVLFHRLRTVSTEVTLAATVVAFRRALGGALTGLMASGTARVARAARIVHFLNSV